MPTRPGTGERPLSSRTIIMAMANASVRTLRLRQWPWNAVAGRVRHRNAPQRERACQRQGAHLSLHITQRGGDCAFQ